MTYKYRENARQALMGNWGKAILISLVAALLGGLVVQTVGDISFDIDENILRSLPDYVKTYLQYAAAIALILGIIQFIMGGVTLLGYSKCLLKWIDGEEVTFSDLFSQMHLFAEGFLLVLLRSLLIALWTLLLVIPGIIATYKYAMAPFLLVENPGMRPLEAITTSKVYMDGFKMDLFILDLSFIGWHLLSILTLGIGYLWLVPYQNVAYAAFYRDLCPKTFSTKTN